MNLPRTIRGRLLTGVLALSLLALLVSGVAVLLAFRDYLTDRTDAQLGGVSDRLKSAIAVRGELRVREGQVAALVPANAVVVIRAGDRPLVSVGAEGDETATLAKVTATSPMTVTGAGRELRVLYIPAGLRLALAPDVLVRADGAVVALDMTNDQDAVANLAVIEAVVAGVAALGLVLLSGAVTRVGLRPLRAMAAAADAIAAGRSGERLPESPPDTETTTLAVALNRAFDAREQAERGLRDFVADASHELRTPLTLIHGWADLSLQGGVAEDAAMERILAESTQMRMLVDELLLLARLDAHQPLAAEQVDLAPVVAEVVADARVVSPDREITLTGAESAVVVGDEVRLRQVVRNLVGNATRHTPPGTAIRVSVGADHEMVTVRIADDGPGIPAGELTRVFERFHRAGRDRVGGSGLGLAIVAAVVGAHGGTVRAESPDGGGALFVVELPGLQETVRSSGG